MMVKNEQKYALRSMKSVASFVDTVVIYDTGSTDDTVAEITKWCADNDKILHVKQGEFIDFSTSRNVLLDFARAVAKEPFFILMDANDEFIGDYDILEKWINDNNQHPLGFIVLCKARCMFARIDNGVVQVLGELAFSGDIGVSTTNMRHARAKMEKRQAYLAEISKLALSHFMTPTGLNVYRTIVATSTDASALYEPLKLDKALKTSFVDVTTGGLDGLEQARRSIKQLMDDAPPCLLGGLFKQVWKYSSSETSYWNVRLIANDPAWKYHGAVHEYLKYGTDGKNLAKTPEETYLFQNRNDDGGKSTARLTQDYEVLSNACKKDPEAPRDTFYLARTCEAQGKKYEAITHYKTRLTLGDFDEEIFWSHMGIANLYKSMGHNLMAISHYTRALEVRKRVEPLLALCVLYNEEKMFYNAFLNIKMAIELPFPETDILFVNATDYDYKRWHLMGIVAYYCQEYEMGERACIKAYEYSGSDVDKNNLNFYRARTGAKN